eukprot:69082-Chlamydomonas_euryale.AAC.1
MATFHTDIHRGKSCRRMAACEVVGASSAVPTMRNAQQYMQQRSTHNEERAAVHAAAQCPQRGTVAVHAAAQCPKRGTAA